MTLHDQEIWLDANISPIIAKWITEQFGWKAKSAQQLALTRASDKEIFDLAKKRGGVIFITKDYDFAKLVHIYQAPPKIILLGIGNCDNRRLWEHLQTSLPKCMELLKNQNHHLVVIA